MIEQPEKALIHNHTLNFTKLIELQPMYDVRSLVKPNLTISFKNFDDFYLAYCSIILAARMTIVFVSIIVLLCVRSRCVCVFTIILFLCWSLGHCVCGENQMIASSLKLSFLGCQSNVRISYFGITNH